MLDMQLSPNCADVLGFVFESESGGSCDDKEPVNLRQRCRDLFRDPVAEILLIFIWAQIKKRQDCNRIIDPAN